MDIEELGQVERCSLPGSGSCGKASPQLFVGCHSNCNVTYHVDVVLLGGMFTANTMSSAVEALGMALPGEEFLTTLVFLDRLHVVVVQYSCGIIRPVSLQCRNTYLQFIHIMLILRSSLIHHTVLFYLQCSVATRDGYSCTLTQIVFSSHYVKVLSTMFVIVPCGRYGLQSCCDQAD